MNNMETNIVETSFLDDDKFWNKMPKLIMEELSYKEAFVRNYNTYYKNKGYDGGELYITDFEEIHDILNDSSLKLYFNRCMYLLGKLMYKVNFISSNKSINSFSRHMYYLIDKNMSYSVSTLILKSMSGLDIRPDIYNAIRGSYENSESNMGNFTNFFTSMWD